MSIFRDFTSFWGNGLNAVAPGGTVRFGSFSGPINSVNQTFAAPEVLGTTANDFRVFFRGLLLDMTEYTFTAPNVIVFTVLVPTPPDLEPQYEIF
jgi:hypothetical protein